MSERELNEYERERRRGEHLAKEHPDYAKAFRAAIEAVGVDYADPEDIYASTPDPPVDEINTYCLFTYLSNEIDRASKPVAGRTKSGATVLVDFDVLPAKDEKWFACRAPFSNYTVSSYARVARLVGKPGATARAVLKPRTAFNFASRQIELVVQLRKDDGQKRNYPVKWLFENHRPKTPSELARRKAAKLKKQAV